MKSKRKIGCFAVILFLLAIGAFFCIGPIRDCVYRSLYPCKFSQLVEEACEKQGLSPSLVYAVIKNESSFRPEAVSSVGARGLMQLTEETFEWVRGRMGTEETFEDMFDPEVNIRYGTYLLSVLLSEFGSQQNALCAYHAGWGSVKKWLADPDYSPDGQQVETIPFADTDYYVDKVQKTAAIYQELYSIP